MQPIYPYLTPKIGVDIYVKQIDSNPYDPAFNPYEQTFNLYL